MQSQNENESVPVVESVITDFIKSELLDELCSLRISFRKPLRDWFVTLHDSLLRVKKHDENHYKRSIELLENNLPELRRIVELYQSDSFHAGLETALNSAAKSLPEKISENQLAHHFEVEEIDSSYVKVGKLLKRGRRRFSRHPMKRQVQIRQLFQDHILESRDWIAEFAAREYDEIGMLIELLLEKSNETDQSDQSADENKKGKKADFKFQIFAELEEHLQVAIQHLKQVEQNNAEQVTQLVESFAHELQQKSRKAGTFQLPQNKERTVADLKIVLPADDLFRQQREQWGRFLTSQCNDLKVQVEIARYGFQASAAKEELLQLTHDFFRDSFYLPFENGIKAAKKAKEVITEMSEKGVEKNLASLREKLSQTLENDLLEPMQDIDRMMEPVHAIQNVLSDLQAESRRFSDEMSLARKRESRYPVPILEMDSIRWQSLAARYMKEEAVKQLDPDLQKFDDLIRQALTTAEEAEQIVDVNLQAAAESTDVPQKKEEGSDEQSPIAISREGIERAISALEKGIREIREKHNVYRDVLETRLPSALQTLAGTMLNRNFDQFELQDKALLVKEQALDWKQKFSSRWATFSDKVEVGWRLALQKFNRYSKIVMPYLGFPGEQVISTREKRNLAEYLARPGVPGDLPFIYKRLFDRNFAIDERFYVAPKNSFSLISDSYDQWSRKLSTNVAVVGEKGSGKTTLLRFAESQCLNGESPATINFNSTFTSENELLTKLCGALGFKPVSGREEFLEKVAKKKKRSVLVIENLQNAYVRYINGFEALEAFWVIMSSTMDKIFWMVSCSRYSWEFFRKISEADQYFSHVVFTDRLDEDEIREAVLSRHKSSGYELYFEPDESLKGSRAYKKVLGDEGQSQELVRNQFFTKLSKISEGNTSIAMIFWLQSIKEIDSQRFVFSPIEVTDIDKLEVPSKEVLFTLAALVQHDMLTRDQAALALHQNVAESSLMLARLKTKGIVYSGQSGFGLNHLVYRQVIRLLKQRNIIH